MSVASMIVPGPDTRPTDFSEQERLRRLGLYKILRTPEPAFDSIARLAADLFDSPIAYLCLTKARSHWVKARIGLDFEEIPRFASFCDHTLRGRDVMVVEDASKD